MKSIAWISLIFTALLAPSAWAHSQVVSQNPAPSSEISSLPPTLDILFNEKLLTLGSGNQLQMLDPNGDEVTTGEVAISNQTISRDLIASTIPGEYYVSYRAVSTDGHVVAGEYTFTLTTASATIKPAPSTPPAPIEESSSNLIVGLGLSTVAIFGLGIAMWRRKAGK